MRKGIDEVEVRGDQLSRRQLQPPAHQYNSGISLTRPPEPPWRQSRGKLMVSSINSHANATSKRWHLWEIDSRSALNSTPGWREFYEDKHHCWAGLVPGILRLVNLPRAGGARGRGRGGGDARGRARDREAPTHMTALESS